MDVISRYRKNRVKIKFRKKKRIKIEFKYRIKIALDTFNGTVIDHCDSFFRVYDIGEINSDPTYVEFEEVPYIVRKCDTARGAPV